MSILIKGMEMPKDGEKLYMITFSDGKACASYKPFEWHEVIPVPDHGDLIDRDALEVHDGWLRDSKYFSQNSSHTHITFVYSNDIVNAPIIIKAEPEVHDCDNCKWFGGLMCDHVDENYKCLGWEAEGGET